MSGDGFAIVNLAAKSLFPAFRPKNTFAMFNDNILDFSFVAPVPRGPRPPTAPSLGFGAVFLNVEQVRTTSIEYFARAKALGKLFIAPDAKGATVFLG